MRNKLILLLFCLFTCWQPAYGMKSHEVAISLTDLPNEVIKDHILEFVPTLFELFTLSVLCKNFKELVDEYLESSLQGSKRSLEIFFPKKGFLGRYEFESMMKFFKGKAVKFLGDDENERTIRYSNKSIKREFSAQPGLLGIKPFVVLEAVTIDKNSVKKMTDIERQIVRRRFFARLHNYEKFLYTCPLGLVCCLCCGALSIAISMDKRCSRPDFVKVFSLTELCEFFRFRLLRPEFRLFWKEFLPLLKKSFSHKVWKASIPNRVLLQQSCERWLQQSCKRLQQRHL